MNFVHSEKKISNFKYWLYSSSSSSSRNPWRNWWKKKKCKTVDDDEDMKKNSSNAYLSLYTTYSLCFPSFKFIMNSFFFPLLFSITKQKISIQSLNIKLNFNGITILTQDTTHTHTQCKLSEFFFFWFFKKKNLNSSTLTTNNLVFYNMCVCVCVHCFITSLTFFFLRFMNPKCME